MPADAAIALRRAARRDALEEAAKVAENFGSKIIREDCANTIASAIRALAGKERT